MALGGIFVISIIVAVEPVLSFEANRNKCTL
jgi:hypothetical protein